MDEEVDFDFFDTPRNDKFDDEKNKKPFRKEQPGPASVHKSKGPGKDDIRYGEIRNKSSSNKKSDDYSSDDSFTGSDSESDTPRYERAPVQNGSGKKVSKADQIKKYQDDSGSESSSAYSNSSCSSNNSYNEEQYNKNNSNVKKEKIDVRLPKAHVEAWGDEVKDYNSKQDKKQIENKDRVIKQSNRGRSQSVSSGSDSDSDKEKYRQKHRSSSHSSKHDRTKYTDKSSDDGQKRKPLRSRSSKHDRTKYTDKSSDDGQKRKPLRSRSSSYSNNSDITDVSPLESPEASPRYSKKHDRNGKKNEKYKEVQYESSSPERGNGIKLETDEIDLSILMKCMADIDREKQQRLKTNSRRVMFAPPAEQQKGNYTFSMGRAKLIEKENQRLLKQIMMQMNSSTAKKAPGSAPRVKGPKKANEPAFQRLTPSAVNRMKEQRRIEAENMHMLHRLQTVRPTRGMSRSEQIDEAERLMSYGIPLGTVIVPGQKAHYETMNMGSSQRSRPSSAKSNTSVVVTPGKRSRPSSAKSNASIRSNASVRSNASRRSTASMRSTISNASERRMADGRIDRRPEWDDRFSFS